jgi:4a-hydroxytetrahydrobiopterin dehydratase
MSRLLTDAEVTRQLGDIDQWARAGDLIQRTIECANFGQAIALVVDVADEAEQMDHHPDIDIRWRTVKFVLTTHSAGGLTQLDIELAHRIEALITELS